MSDRELLEAAARAAGIPPEVVGAPPGLYWIESTKSTHNQWNPLKHSGQALELAVKLRIDIDYMPGGDCVVAWGSDRSEEALAPDPMAATRRAIVRAAAAIDQAMGKL